MPGNPHSALPLIGVKVIDFGQYMAGPAVAMILADLGATVVHVDPPGGPLWTTPANATLNRNKLIVQIDLKTAEGLEQARDLIEEADIVIESFRPGVMARLGLDFQQLREARPELITLSIPGFASNDELRRDWRAFESVIAANSGVFTDMGLNRVLMGVNPSFSPLPLASAYGTMLAASAVVLALQARERTGLGDQVEVPLVAAVMEGLSYNSIKIEDYPERYKTQREQEIERRRIEGLPMNLSYDELQELLDPFYRSYKCKDGRQFYVVCPSHKSHAKRCLKTLGIYDELVEEGLREEEDTYRPVSEWASDVSLGVYPLPKFWADKIAARMKEVFITRTAKEWERIFGRGKFPGAPQRWLQEWIHDDHAETAGLMIEVEDPEFGTMTQPGPMVWLEESGEEMLEPQPRRWVSFETALRRLTAIETKLPRVRAKNARDGWLQGVRILDLCNVIAGPHSVAYLARFGAEVIKLDPSKPFYDCWNTVIFGMSHMRGKRSVLTDISAPEGREIFVKLVKSADVIVWNATDRQVRAMGLDAQGLRALNPEAIFCQLDCFGGVRPGPRTNYLGYDDLVQATTGIMLRFGGEMDTPEEHAHVGTIDVMCGFGGSLGIAAALYQKLKTGRVGRPRTSLAALSGLAQMPFCYDYERRGLFDEPAGRECNGFDDLARFYYTSSGSYVLLSAYESDVERIDKVAGLEGFAEVVKEGRAAFLANAFIGAEAGDWVNRLQKCGVAAAVCENLDTIRAYHSRPADGTPGTDRGSYSFSVYEDHPSGHVVTQLDPYAIRPVRGKIYALEPAQQYGASTREVLCELGYDEAAIDAMIESGAVSERWSREYLPS
ncbi:dimethylsulfoniopropionate cleavage enzyme DddD [Modicisalibacter ilicicola DSM 19980]|uniref:Dimethylsulfoniopropionate cleavage enzyme DddD n=1 Tax=Modicisalibacter ilicicola DSM 19980 TaxID=1121942 RepID=A0A1M5D783_9GAMM|nr:CoA transferase [Halomonas ilicicola]SHF62532.1 dimethylsulfoniopropionate cleavage enzyme DddD [Halomonas ilicicola DSM 19980]